MGEGEATSEEFVTWRKELTASFPQCPFKMLLPKQLILRARWYMQSSIHGTPASNTCSEKAKSTAIVTLERIFQKFICSSPHLLFPCWNQWPEFQNMRLTTVKLLLRVNVSLCYRLLRRLYSCLIMTNVERTVRIARKVLRKYFYMELHYWFIYSFFRYSENFYCAFLPVGTQLGQRWPVLSWMFKPI